MYEQDGEIEMGIMTNDETGERRVGITFPDGQIILLTAEQGRAFAVALNESIADIEAQPYAVSAQETH